MAMAKLTATVSLKKIVGICPLNLIHFSIHRVKIGSKWMSSFLLIIAENHATHGKYWWIEQRDLVAAGLIFGYVLYYLVK